jgi:hypothetical protein
MILPKKFHTLNNFFLSLEKINLTHNIVNILVSNEKWSNNYVLKKLYDFFIINTHASKEARIVKTKEKNSIIKECQLHYLT